ncbi:MAG: carotenoid biosynthesis protein [Thermodesulfobacteriota bacterium]
MILLLELTGIFFGLSIVLSYAIRSPRPARALLRAAIISASAWIAEESCILLYRFYDYHAGWNLFLDRVPLLVVVIWPVIILSARDLTSHLRAAHPGKGPLAGAAVVATDALFIEPIATGTGIWSWNLPGLFNVPPVGILGWFYFALLWMYLLDDKTREGPLSAYDLQLLVLPVMGTHLLLLLTWWGALRWMNHPLPDPAIAAAAWFVSFFMTVAIYKNQTGRRIHKKTLLLRLPAALFFLVLLTFKAAGPFSLTVYALAFVPPYGMLMAQQYRYPDQVI